MKALSEFGIQILSLSNKTHRFDYEIDSSFFSKFENSPITEATLKVSVILEKSTLLIQLDVVISGKATLVSDRSLREFEEPIEISKSVYYKYGEKEEEVGEDIYTITHHTSEINIGQLIYEYVGLWVPIKKLHPDERTGEDLLDDEMGNLSLVYTSTSEEEPDAEGDETIDPRWEALKSLKTK